MRKGWGWGLLGFRVLGRVWFFLAVGFVAEALLAGRFAAPLAPACASLSGFTGDLARLALRSALGAAYGLASPLSFYSGRIWDLSAAPAFESWREAALRS